MVTLFLSFREMMIQMILGIVIDPLSYLSFLNTQIKFRFHNSHQHIGTGNINLE